MSGGQAKQIFGSLLKGNNVLRVKVVVVGQVQCGAHVDGVSRCMVGWSSGAV